MIKIFTFSDFCVEPVLKSKSKFVNLTVCSSLTKSLGTVQKFKDFSLPTVQIVAQRSFFFIQNCH